MGMNQQDLELLNLENKMMNLRGELNNYIYNHSQGSQELLKGSELTEAKKQQLLSELAYFENQIQIIKHTVQQPAGASMSSHAHTAEEKLQVLQERRGINEEPAILHEDGQQEVQFEQVWEMSDSEPQPVPPVMSEPQPAPPVMNRPQPRPVREKKDFEKTVGKIGYGIFASILIFISIIMFAMVLLPFLTDALKITAMYIFSGAFIGIGLYKTKSQGNTFYSAVLGCGMGAVYITLFIHNLYFQSLDDILMYLIIMVWTIGVMLLSKYRSHLFDIIGIIGIVFAVFIGSIWGLSQHSAVKVMFVCLFCVVAMLVFGIKQRRGRLLERVVYHIGCYCNFAIFSIVLIQDFFGSSLDRGFMNAGVALVIGLILFNILSNIICNEYNSPSYNIFMCFDATALIYFVSVLLHQTILFENSDMGLGVVFICAGLILMVIDQIQKKRFEATEFNLVADIYCGILLLLSCYSFVSFTDAVNIDATGIVGVIFVALFLVIYKTKRASSLYKYLALGLLVIFIGEMNIFASLILWAGFVVCLYLEYFKVDKWLYFGYINLWLIKTMSDMTDFFSLPGYMGSAFLYLSVGVLFFACYHLLKIDFQTREEESLSNVLLKIYSVCINCIGLSVLYSSSDDPALHIVVVAMTIALFVFGAKNRGSFDKSIWGIYLGIRYTVLLYCILSSFEAESYLVSFATFVISILFIVLGFKKSLKSLRIYGLILSMISVFKLVLVDITADNTLAKAMGFLVCGLLCFVISWIYFYLDKKLTVQE